MSSFPLNVITEALHLVHKKRLNYKPRNDIQIYKPKRLESTFKEITQDKEHIVVGLDTRPWNWENSIVTTYQTYKKSFH